MKQFLSLLAAVAALFIFQNSSFGQTRYKYVDESGVQVFTNIPPVRPIPGLEVTGAPVQEAPVDAAKPKSASYDPIIEKYASNYQLDPHLIRSIIATESGFNPKAVSPKGARGLMQLMPETAARLGVKNSFDPEQNIQGGVKHFKFLMDNFKNNVELSLAAYNAGENLVQRIGRVPAIRETRDYVQSVTKRYGKLEMTSQAQVEDMQKNPPIFRFVDETGTLHLTNIPPLHQ
jgi:soluble lytic murein transglycosylase-like protein